jgi:hypothetical protein
LRTWSPPSPEKSRREHQPHWRSEPNSARDLFKEVEDRIAAAIECCHFQSAELEEVERMDQDMAARFEEVVRILSKLDLGIIWIEANDRERRVLI